MAYETNSEPGTEPFRNRQGRNGQESNGQLFQRKRNGTEPVLHSQYLFCKLPGGSENDFRELEIKFEKVINWNESGCEEHDLPRYSRNCKRSVGAVLAATTATTAAAATTPTFIPKLLWKSFSRIENDVWTRISIFATTTTTTIAAATTTITTITSITTIEI